MQVLDFMMKKMHFLTGTKITGKFSGMFNSNILLLFCLVTQSCPTFCNPMDCITPISSIHEIFLARILEWVAVSLLATFEQALGDGQGQGSLACCSPWVTERQTQLSNWATANTPKPKLNKDITRKLQTNMSYEYRCKNHDQILRNWTKLPATYKKRLYTITKRDLSQERKFGLAYEKPV